jgi:hypothetical protein
MEHVHLDADRLLQASYGVVDDSAAWRDCAVCVAALEAMSLRRRAKRVEDSLPEWFWLRQRQAAIGASTTPRRPRWVALGALAGMAMLAILAMQPAPATPPTPRVAAEDERLFNEVSERVTRVEPRALAPMDELWARP